MIRLPSSVNGVLAQANDLIGAWQPRLLAGLRTGDMSLVSRHSELLLSSLLDAVRRVAVGVRPALSPGSQRPTITVHLENGIARVVVLTGQEVLAWGMTPMAEGTRGTEDDAAPESQLGAMLEELAAPRGRLVTSLPLYTSLVRHLDLAKIDRRYLSQVVTTEILENIPFTHDEVDIAWQHRRAEDREEIFTVTESKQAMDRHVRMLKEAGHRPSAAYLTSGGLALAVGVPDTIVIDLASPRTTVVLVRKGLPHVVHQVDLSHDGGGPQERALAVTRAVDQVVGYHPAVNGKSEESPLPAVLTGPLTRDDRLVGALEPALNRQVLPFMPPFTYPAHFPYHEYAANLGLAVADRLRGQPWRKLFTRSVPSLNVLPERHRPRGLPTIPALVFFSLFLMTLLAWTVSDRVDSLESTRDALATEVAGLGREVRQHKLSLARADRSGAMIAELAKFTSGLESTLEALSRDRQTLVAELDAVTRNAVAHQVTLSTLLSQQDELILSGTSPSFESVSGYSGDLRASDIFSQVEVAHVQSSGPLAALGSDESDTAFQIAATVATMAEPPGPDGQSAEQ